uniref:Uncharacterized protein n=1 Tax=Chlamydomonas euryale TaxID=1486919 RepID=A0A7R9YV60_9CHLO|mmetsp:Transcript_27510/g.81526  ORF Transcript_27510/g.81526 Transcript_27510/m.81526 type:complete len:101 (+) Transcript_27510:469-771(+)
MSAAAQASSWVQPRGPAAQPLRSAVLQHRQADGQLRAAALISSRWLTFVQTKAWPCGGASGAYLQAMWRRRRGVSAGPCHHRASNRYAERADEQLGATAH